MTPLKKFTYALATFGLTTSAFAQRDPIGAPSSSSNQVYYIVGGIVVVVVVVIFLLKGKKKD